MSSDYSDMPLPPNWESRLDSESGHWSQKNPKSVNPKPCDDHSKDGPATKTHRSRIEPNGENSSRKDTYSKGRPTSTHRNRESKSSVCSQNDNESYHSSIYFSPKTNKKSKYDSLLPKTPTDNDDHNVDDNVFATESIKKGDTSESTQNDKESLQINRLSLEKHVDTAVTTTTVTSNTVILTENNPLQKNNGSSRYPDQTMGLILCSTEKLHRYQPIGPNSKLLGSRIISHGPNPLFVHGPNPSLIAQSPPNGRVLDVYNQEMSYQDERTVHCFETKWEHTLNILLIRSNNEQDLLTLYRREETMNPHHHHQQQQQQR
ncbi:uncharacterized protein DC041_0001239 [Schistosoma bovis]|uniref:Uncharacterized protein n=1 Tax=Schistosoma bovis TaxID=6184 RepID=A0A430QL98_SCHBO|nr:uncharacterized protein DC041_0001239 [Schistosoma bovis]